jgi:hypothetical protein
MRLAHLPCFAILLLSLVGMRVEANCTMEKLASLPATVRDGRIFVPGSIEGHPVEFLVDLAAPTLLLKGASRDFSVFPNNLHAVPTAMVGNLPVEHLPLKVAGSIANFGAPQAVAILGRDFFYIFDVEFDIHNHVITLFNPKDCQDANLAYWTSNYNVLTMHKNFTHFVNLPPVFSPYIYPHINLDVKLNGRPILAALDSGYRETSVSLTAAHDAGIDRGDAGVAHIDNTPDLLDGYGTQTWLATFDSVSLDSETIRPAALRFHDFWGGGAQTGTGLPVGGATGSVEMVLGADFLVSHRVLISYSQHKVYFSYAGGTPFSTGPSSAEPALTP